MFLIAYKFFTGTKQLVQALDSVPRQTRHLYLHSYQSFVWNRVASMRLKKYGLNVVVGDLVKVHNKFVFGISFG